MNLSRKLNKLKTDISHIGLKDISKEDNVVEKLLKNGYFVTNFSIFSAKEFSMENVNYWLDVQAFEKSPNIPRAKRIYNQYVKANSPHEINLPGKVRNEIGDYVNNIDGFGDIFTLKKAFEPARNDALLNMTDTLSRFRYTTEGKNALKVNGYY